MRKIALQLDAPVHFILKDWTDEGLRVCFNLKGERGEKNTVFRSI